MPISVPIVVPKNPDECPGWLYEALKRLSQTSTTAAQALSSIGRNESPDGSGSPLIDTSKFFYKPGLPGGQIAFGGSNSGDFLVLSSTSGVTKGKIYLGSARGSAFDEVNGRMGLGTTSPSAVLEIIQTTGLTQGAFAPASDGATPGPWTGFDGLGSPLYTYLDETSPNDTDYIRDGGAPSGVHLDVIRLATVSPTPSTSDTVVLKWRIGWFGSNRGTAGNAFILHLRNSAGTGVFDSASIDLTLVNPNAFTTYTHTLTAAEITTMSTWSGIRIGLECGGGGVGYSGNVRLSWVQMDTVTASSQFNLTDWYDALSNLVVRIDTRGNLILNAQAASGMAHIVPRLATTPGLWLQQQTSQSADMLRVQNSTGAAALAGLNSAGAYYLVAGGATGSLYVSDSGGVGSWAATTALTLAVKDALFTIVDDGDVTKKLAFQVSGITTGTTRTLTLFDLNSSLIVLGNQTAVATAGNLGKRDLTAQAAAIGSTNLTATALVGYYRVMYYLEVTTADAGAVSVQFQVNHTDDIGATNQVGAVLALTAQGRDRGSFEVYLASGELSFQTNVVTIGTARYALRIRVFYLG